MAASSRSGAETGRRTCRPPEVVYRFSGAPSSIEKEWNPCTGFGIPTAPGVCTALVSPRLRHPSVAGYSQSPCKTKGDQ